MINNLKPKTVSHTMLNESFHLFITLVTSLFVYFYTSNILAGLLCATVGMFLDSDHLLDYLLYLYKFKRPFKLQEFLSGSYFDDWKKFLCPLHSYELGIIAFITFALTDNPYLLALSVAIFQHLSVDYYSNFVKLSAYSIIYRGRHHFIKAAIKTDFKS